MVIPNRMTARTPSGGRTGDMRHLRIVQVNMRYSHFGFTLLQQFLRHHSVDILLIQDPPQAILSGQGNLPGYDFIVSSSSDSVEHAHRPLTAIVLRSCLHYTPLPCVHRRICGILLSTCRGPLALFSAYLHHVGGEGLVPLSSLIASVRPRTPLLLVGADCNGHSS